MILKQHHFQTPERPKEEDYRIIGVESQKSHVGVLRDGGIYNKEPFQKDLAEWESLYGQEEPQPELKDHTSQPLSGKRIWIDDGKYERSFLYTEDDGPVKYGDKWMYEKDKATFDTRLQRWKDHQVKFPNFKKDEYYSGITEFYREFEDNQVTICFRSDSNLTEVSIFNQDETFFEMTSSNGIEVEEFEMALKNRNIKL